MEQASRAILAGLFFYNLVQDISNAGYPQTHKEREGAFKRARATCKHTVEAISAKSAQLKQRHIRLRLEEAAKAGNETGFLDALKEVDWREKSASEYIHIIDLALEAGAHLAARRIAFAGLDRYQNNPQLRECARILAPPRVTSIDIPSDIKQGENLNWLQNHAHKYRGRWVAIKDGQLIGVANSYKDLASKVGETQRTDILITKAF